MGRLIVTMRSGAVVEANADNVTVRHAEGGPLRGLDWHSDQPVERELLWMDLAQVDSVVFVKPVERPAPPSQPFPHPGGDPS